MPADEIPAVGIVLARRVTMHQEHQTVPHQGSDCDRDLGNHAGTLGALPAYCPASLATTGARVSAKSAPMTKYEKPISSRRRWISSAAAAGSLGRMTSESAARSAAVSRSGGAMNGATPSPT